MKINPLLHLHNSISKTKAKMLLMIIHFTTLFFLLLVIGVFWGPWLAIHRSINVFTKEEFVKITNIMAKNLGRPMQILMPLCILSMALSILFYPQKSCFEFYLIIASFCGIIITLVVTLTTELPIVNEIRQWTTETIPSEWESIRDKWARYHYLRVFPSLISFGLYLVAILV